MVAQERAAQSTELLPIMQAAAAADTDTTQDRHQSPLDLAASEAEVVAQEMDLIL